MAKLNYATEYLQTLEQMFPYVCILEIYLRHRITEDSVG